MKGQQKNKYIYFENLIIFSMKFITEKIILLILFFFLIFYNIKKIKLNDSCKIILIRLYIDKRKLISVRKKN